ncbi:WxL protein peptidoglycan domain-containing protein [Microbacterium invictum]|uniref:DUF916 domain-containing protein n=1 Tax=Microbacterium invictum TaxID=515415 RepID=A0ABZ0VD28_9MICO|nr:DUF916 domain-containing protein [Microbacterium invictum]WQB70803.1 hypothetical protein T9R20_02260 [Microbacterium invictum]
MRRRMTRAGLVAAIALSGASLLGVVPAAAAAPVAVVSAGAASAATDDEITWSVTPADEACPDQRGVIEQELDPGQSRTDRFAVRNFSAIPVTFALSAADGYYSDNGRFTMLPSSEPSVDAGTWITLPESVTVEPGGTTVVTFTTEVPDDAVPGDHAAGIAASVLSAGTDATGTGVGVESRVGFRITTRVTGELAPAATVQAVAGSYDLSWNPFRPGEATVSFEVTNTGNTAVQAQGTLTAGSASADFPAAGEAVQQLLPGETRTLTLALAGVWPTVVVPLAVDLTPTARDFAGSDLPVTASAASATLWALPLPQLILLVGVGLLLAALLWRRRRSRARLAAIVAAAREEGFAAARTVDGASAEPALAQSSATATSPTIDPSPPGESVTRRSLR